MHPIERHGVGRPPKRAQDVLLTFPARKLWPEERELVDDWVSAGHGMTKAAVYEQRSDDPALYQHIVISLIPGVLPSHILHSPAGIPCWLLRRRGPPTRVDRFESLREALNSIRRVLP